MKCVQPEVLVYGDPTGWVEVCHGRCRASIGKLCQQRGSVIRMHKYPPRIGRAVVGGIQVFCCFCKLLGVIQNPGEKEISIKEKRSRVRMSQAKIVDECAKSKVECSNIGGFSSLTSWAL